MNEKILKFEKGPKFKKYTAYIQHKKTKKIENCTLGTNVINNIKIGHH